MVKASLDQTYRLAYLYIGWSKGQAPKELSILYSNDDKVYYEGMPFGPAKLWLVFP